MRTIDRVIADAQVRAGWSDRMMITLLTAFLTDSLDIGAKRLDEFLAAAERAELETGDPLDPGDDPPEYQHPEDEQAIVLWPPPDVNIESPHPRRT